MARRSDSRGSRPGAQRVTAGTTCRRASGNTERSCCARSSWSFATCDIVTSFRKPSYTLGYANTNPLIANSRWRIDLSKTGYLDEAGRCLVMVAEIDGRRIGIVLLNSFGTRTPQGDATRVRRWLESESVTPVAGAALEYERRVAKAYDEPVPAIGSKPARTIAPSHTPASSETTTSRRSSASAIASAGGSSERALGWNAAWAAASTS